MTISSSEFNGPDDEWRTYLWAMVLDARAENAALRAMVERAGIPIDERAFHRHFLEARVDQLAAMGQYTEGMGIISVVLFDEIEKFRRQIDQGTPSNETSS